MKNVTINISHINDQSPKATPTLWNNLLLFGAIGTLGLGTALLRFLPQYRKSNKPDAIAGLIAWARKVSVFASLFSAAVFFATIYFSPKVNLDWWQLALFAVCIVMWSFVALNRHMLRALGVVFWSEFSYQLLRPGLAVVTLVLGLLFLTPDLVVFAALALPLAIGLIHDFWRLRKTIGPNTAQVTDLSDERAIWAKSSKSYTIVMMTNVMMQRAVISSTANSLVLMSGHERLLSRLMAMNAFVILPLALALGVSAYGLLGAACAVTAVRWLASGTRIYLAKSIVGYQTILWPTRARLQIAFSPILNRLNR